MDYNAQERDGEVSENPLPKRVSMDNTYKEESSEDQDLRQLEIPCNACAVTVCMNENSGGKPNDFREEKDEHNEVVPSGYDTNKESMQSDNAEESVNTLKKSVGQPHGFIRNESKPVEYDRDVQSSCSQYKKQADVFKEDNGKCDEDADGELYKYENNEGLLTCNTCTVFTYEDGMAQLDACTVYIENSPGPNDAFKNECSFNEHAEGSRNNCNKTREELDAFSDTTDTHIQNDHETVNTCANSEGKGQDDDFLKNDSTHTKRADGKDQFTEENQYRTSVDGLATVQVHVEQPFLMNLCDFSAQQSIDLTEHSQTHTEEENDEEIMKCNMCPFSSRYPRQMKIHKPNHAGDKTYKCDMCSYSASRQYFLNVHKVTHLNEKESEGKYFTCEWCDFKTLWEKSLRKHQRKHTIEKSDLGDLTTSKDVDLTDFEQTNQGKQNNDNILKCDMCPYLTKYPRQMKIHKTNHAKDTLFKCDMCSYSASRSYYLKVHKQTHTGETFKFDATSFSTRRLDYRKRNKLKHTGGGPFLCDMCGYKALCSSALSAHRRKHTGEKPYACNLCDYSGATSGQLKAHKLIHTSEKSSTCDECDYTSKRLDEIARHKKKHSKEKEDGGKFLTCEWCDFRTLWLSSLINHKRKHAREQFYYCDECNLSTKYAGSLKKHKLQHSYNIEKPYMCEICGFRTHKQGYIKVHKRRHTGERPYTCDLCDFATAWSEKLRIHKRIHTGEKPFKCDVCNFSSRRPDYLKAHKMIHTGEKPYKCDICDFSTRGATNLRKHKQKHLPTNQFE